MRPILCLAFLYTFSLIFATRLQAQPMLVLFCETGKSEKQSQRVQVACLRAHRSGKSRLGPLFPHPSSCHCPLLTLNWRERVKLQENSEQKRESKERVGRSHSKKDQHRKAHFLQKRAAGMRRREILQAWLRWELCMPWDHRG